LITSSNFVATRTGRSAGSAPRRMRLTYSDAPEGVYGMHAVRHEAPRLGINTDRGKLWEYGTALQAK
jgi:hypothetical protein